MLSITGIAWLTPQSRCLHTQNGEWYTTAGTDQRAEIRTGELNPRRIDRRRDVLGCEAPREHTANLAGGHAPPREDVAAPLCARRRGTAATPSRSASSRRGTARYLSQRGPMTTGRTDRAGTPEHCCGQPNPHICARRTSAALSQTTYATASRDFPRPFRSRRPCMQTTAWLRPLGLCEPAPTRDACAVRSCPPLGSGASDRTTATRTRRRPIRQQY